MKYVFREVPPEETDSQDYYDLENDYDYESIVISSDRNYDGFKGKDFEKLIIAIEDHDLSYAECLMPHYGMTATRKEDFYQAAKLYNEAEREETRLNALADAMTAVTDEPYTVKGIHGSCQGDYFDVVCKVSYDVSELQAFVFNTGSIFVNQYDESYYLTQGYSAETFKKELSEITGEPIENIKLKMFKGYSRKATYAKAC